MAITETTHSSPERTLNEQVDIHGYIRDVINYEQNYLPSIYRLSTGPHPEDIKYFQYSTDRHGDDEDITEEILDFQQQAADTVVFCANQLHEQPGVNSNDEQVFKDIVTNFALSSARLHKIGLISAPMAQLNGHELLGIADDLVDRYMPIVRLRNQLTPEKAWPLLGRAGITLTI